jgi:hypothetical protein
VGSSDRLLDPVFLSLVAQHHHSTGLMSPERYDKRYEQEVFEKHY